MNTNPFCTRRVRPGALAYRFPPGDSIDRLLARLREHGGRGEIVGPHGSGKSTLLEAVAAAWRAGGGTVVFHRLRDGQRRLRRAIICGQASGDGDVLLAVDGYEQLGRMARWRLRRAADRQGCGLVVTAHRPTGLPPLADTTPDLPTVLALVADLTDRTACPVFPLDVIASFVRRRTDVREMLFDLYLLHERRRRGERIPS